MTRKQLLENLDVVCKNYLNSHHRKWRGKELREDDYALLVHELIDQWRSFWYNPMNPSEKISTKIKFSSSYRRKVVVRIFSELGLTVTRYTREYGRTIVHFEDASNLSQ